MKKCPSKMNGKKGGRPNSNKYNNAFSIPDITFVILTEKQYNTLLERYGGSLLKHALVILEDWLKTSRLGSKYQGKNNYAHFRSDGWVINEAKCTSIQKI